jgi:hypothetical protein
MTRCPRCRFKLDRAADADHVAQCRARYGRGEQPQPTRRAAPRKLPEQRVARDWYWWLWLSPLLTLPTAVMVALNVYDGIGRDLACGARSQGYYRCDYELLTKVSLVLAFVVSALWHLLLLIPARDKRIFVRWHGRQALALAGLRTAVPLLITLVSQDESHFLLAIPLLIVIWFAGNWWGRWQAKVGRCSLMHWAGHQQKLAQFQRELRQPVLIELPDPDLLVIVISYNRDARERERALDQLISLGMVEYL